MDYLMNYFELLLTLAVLVTGLVYAIDAGFLAKKRAQDKAMPKWIEQCRSFFPVLLIVLIIRSFLFEPYRIPSGSLKPTLLVGDLIVVNKFTYGIRLPVLHSKIIPLSEPKIGDIVVFRMPGNPHMDLIKRIVGVPGDHLSYIDKILYINGKAMSQTDVGTATDSNRDTEAWPVKIKQEALTNQVHQIYVRPDLNLSGDFQDIVVPPGHYFAMGDNRDDSNDSRFWGFVPEENIVGQAKRILISWDSEAPWSKRIRWSRTGESIH